MHFKYTEIFLGKSVQNIKGKFQVSGFRFQKAYVLDSWKMLFHVKIHAIFTSWEAKEYCTTKCWEHCTIYDPIYKCINYKNYFI